MKTIWMTFLMMVINQNLFSQFTLEGLIMDSGSEPVHNALVELIDQVDSTRKFIDYTDEQGRYSIQIIETGLFDNQVSNNRDFRLLQNYPNPFSSSTIICYELTPPALIHIDIYNIVGCKIKTLYDGIKTDHIGWIEWDATDNSGQRISPGVYIFSMQVNGIQKYKKMILLNDLTGTTNFFVPHKTEINETEQKIQFKSTANQFILRVSGDSIEPYEQLNLEIIGNTILDISVYRTIKDIDGNVYRIIKIGNHWWMAENLKATHYRNGEVIPEVTDETSWNGLTTGAYCNYNNSEDTAKTYGRLYNWYAVNDTGGLAPEGWHVANDKDWLIMELLLGANDTAGGQLKEKDNLHWLSPNTAATNNFKFSALPGGYRNCDNGLYANLGSVANFWCSTERNNGFSWVRGLKHNSSELYRLYSNKAIGMSVRCVKDFPINDHNQVNKGYYLVQFVNSLSESLYGGISTTREADSIVDVLKKHSVSGVEYGSIYFHPQDMAASVIVAEVFKETGIDLWLTSAGLQGRFEPFNNDVFPSQFRACSMTADGSIVPAYVHSLSAGDQKVEAFDALDPEAMNWFIPRYKEIFLDPLAPYTSGYFFDEDCLYYGPYYPNNTIFAYWELPAYSDAVLHEWQKYCIEHAVIFNDQVVTKFPVHSESMVSNGGGKTQYYPGYGIPSAIEFGTPLVSVPRNTGVWAAWDDFVTTQYATNWIGRLAKAVYEVNINNPDFKGVMYFGLHNWSLGYEEVTDTSFVVDSYHHWVPWGTQRGIRLSKICTLPYMDHIICETYPPLQSNLYSYVSTYKQIIESYNKTFGVMLHRDDSWGLDTKDTEIDRWEAIEFFQPTIITRYPIFRLFPTDPYYNDQKEALFDQRLLEYRK